MLHFIINNWCLILITAIIVIALYFASTANVGTKKGRTDR